MEKSNLTEEVEHTLLSLEGLTRASAPDSLLESITSKIIFREDQALWIRRVKYAAAAMLALAIVNTSLLINNNNSAREEMLNSVASEWNQTFESY